MVTRQKIRNIGDFEDLLNIVSSSIGSLTNLEKLKTRFAASKNQRLFRQRSAIFNYLEESFLLESAIRYDIKGKAYIETPKKYYFTDLGLRNARIQFRQLEPNHAMENVIYNELRMRGYRTDIGVIPVFEKDKTGQMVRKQLEVDFICYRGSNR